MNQLVSMHSQVCRLSWRVSGQYPCKDMNINHVIDTSFLFLEVLPDMWQKLEPAELRVLRNILFPKNLVHTYPGFQTAELMPIYALNKASTEKKDDWASP